MAFERPGKIQMRIDSLGHIDYEGHLFDFLGRSLVDSVPDLNIIQSYQEFWGSWITFHPRTTKFDALQSLE